MLRVADDLDAFLLVWFLTLPLLVIEDVGLFSGSGAVPLVVLNPVVGYYIGTSCGVVGSTRLLKACVTNLFYICF